MATRHTDDPRDTPRSDFVERELLVPATPDSVWEIVTGPGWLADQVELEPVPGGEATFRTDEWVRRGWVEEASAPDPPSGTGGRLTFWWAQDDEPASRVALTLEPEGEGLTLVRVIETRPLDVLDVVGVPFGGAGGTTHGPALLAGV